MLVHCRVTPSDKFAGTSLYTSVERGTKELSVLHSTSLCTKFYFLIAQSNRVLCFFFSGFVFRGHFYSSRMLCRKYVCRQAADAFVLRLHDVSGTLLKTIFHVFLLTNSALED